MENSGRRQSKRKVTPRRWWWLRQEGQQGQEQGKEEDGEEEEEEEEEVVEQVVVEEEEKEEEEDDDDDAIKTDAHKQEQESSGRARSSWTFVICNLQLHSSAQHGSKSMQDSQMQGCWTTHISTYFHVFLIWKKTL